MLLKYLFLYNIFIFVLPKPSKIILYVKVQRDQIVESSEQSMNGSKKGGHLSHLLKNFEQKINYETIQLHFCNLMRAYSSHFDKIL